MAANGINMRVEHAQKTAFLGTVRSLRLILVCYHCSRLCETFDNSLLFTLTGAGASINNALSIIIIGNKNIINNNSNNNIIIVAIVIISIIKIIVIIMLILPYVCNRSF